MKRYGLIVGLREEKIEEYNRLHADVWPDVLDRIHRSNIRNYSIFLRRLPDGKHYLFSYFEYVGSDFAVDMAAMAADPRTQEWWKITDPCQEPLPDRAEGEWWAAAQEVFHVD
ncbi:MAG: L-rhamnose mutarotase [Spirochaetaceae bacterium]|nr:L-rhamnose mutarotase [Spirochaetaceae bacterium]